MSMRHCRAYFCWDPLISDASVQFESPFSVHYLDTDTFPNGFFFTKLNKILVLVLVDLGLYIQLRRWWNQEMVSIQWLDVGKLHVMITHQFSVAIAVMLLLANFSVAILMTELMVHVLCGFPDFLLVSCCYVWFSKTIIYIFCQWILVMSCKLVPKAFFLVIFNIPCFLPVSSFLLSFIQQFISVSFLRLIYVNLLLQKCIECPNLP